MTDAGISERLPDQRCNSIHRAIRFARDANLLGIGIHLGSFPLFLVLDSPKLVPWKRIEMLTQPLTTVFAPPRE